MTQAASAGYGVDDLSGDKHDNGRLLASVANCVEGKIQYAKKVLGDRFWLCRDDGCSWLWIDWCE
jgi:hypothetical protein